MAYKTIRRVDWGDCDAAGIVFYPNYFRWMDGAFHQMTMSLGFDQRSLSDHGVFATPLRDVGANFVSPASYGADLEVSVSVTRLGRSGFSLSYRFEEDGRLVATGHEVRVCVQRDEMGRIGPTPIPHAIRALLARHSA